MRFNQDITADGVIPKSVTHLNLPSHYKNSIIPNTVIKLKIRYPELKND